MSMVNDTGEKLYLVGADTGQVLLDIGQGEIINVRSQKQALNDKMFASKVKLKSGRFIKVMEKEKEVRKKLVKYPSTYFALSVMKDYIVYGNNLLMKNGKKFRCNDLAKEMEISRQMASVHIKRLQELNYLAEVPTTRGNYWAINPDYYRTSEEVPKLVYDAFNPKLKI